MEIYLVQSGDTLLSIAEQYGVPVGRLASDNALSGESPLAVGQALVIWQPTETWTVSAGETLWSVAAETGVSVRRLWQLNPQLGGGTALEPGQTLAIRVGESAGDEISINGYAYTNIDRAVLRQTLPYLTYLSIFSYGISPTGELLEPDDEELIALAKEYRVVPLLMLSTLGSDGTFNSDLASLILSDTAIRARLIEELLNTLERKGYGGMDIDFEFVQPEERTAYVEFVRELTTRLNAAGYLLIVALAPKTFDEQPGLLYEAHDYAALGAAANVSLLMTYEWGYTFGPPMAVSPLNKVREVLVYGVSRIEPQKIFMGVPNYGYDWTLPFVSGESRAQSLGNVRAAELAAEYGATILYDEVANAPYYFYTDESGAEHEVWFEDARSAEAQLALMPELGLRGMAVWNIMRWFPALWLAVAFGYAVRQEPIFPQV